MNDRITTISEQLKKELDKARYDHTLGVMYTAGCLAMRYGENMNNALLAGLLHDCAKCIPHNEKIRLCKTNHIFISDTEMKNPGLLHAKLGAFLAEHKYGIKDKEIIRAIESHTTGRPNMSLLDKIIYIADYMEPGRDRAGDLPHVRDLAFKDLDACLYVILEDSLNFLKKRKIPIDPMTEDTFLYYNNLKQKTSNH